MHRDGFRCECARLGCNDDRRAHRRAIISEIRTHPRYFVLAPGHELPDVEQVVETGADLRRGREAGQAGRLGRGVGPSRLIARGRVQPRLKRIRTSIPPEDRLTIESRRRPDDQRQSHTKPGTVGAGEQAAAVVGDQDPQLAPRPRRRSRTPIPSRRGRHAAATLVRASETAKRTAAICSSVPPASAARVAQRSADHRDSRWNPPQRCP